MDLHEFLATHVSHWSRLILDPKAFGALQCNTPLTPTHYLTFAEKDLRLGGPRGLVNSLTNTKRAIDCQIFNLLSALKIPEKYSFPGRLDTLKDLGLVAPRIVRKIVQLRNVLEHDYYLPKLSEAEDAFDVAQLFIATLKPYFAGGSYMESAWLADDTSANPWTQLIPVRNRSAMAPRFTFARGIYINSEIGAGRIELDLVHDNIKVGVAIVEPKDPSYIDLQGLLLRAMIDNFEHSRRGAKRFMKALRGVAP